MTYITHGVFFLFKVFSSRRTLLGAPGLTTRNKKLLGAPGIATPRGSLGHGLQPKSNGVQPNNDGLQPSSFLLLVAMASNRPSCRCKPGAARASQLRRVSPHANPRWCSGRSTETHEVDAAEGMGILRRFHSQAFFAKCQDIAPFQGFFSLSDFSRPLGSFC